MERAPANQPAAQWISGNDSVLIYMGIFYVHLLLLLLLLLICCI